MQEITTEEEFFDFLSKEQLILLDCFTEWCGPCRMIKTILEQLSEEYKTIKFIKVDVEQVSELMATYDIRSVPLLILFKNGQEIARQVGAISKKQLEEFLNTNTQQEKIGYEKESTQQS